MAKVNRTGKMVYRSEFIWEKSLEYWWREEGTLVGVEVLELMIFHKTIINDDTFINRERGESLLRLPAPGL